MDAWLVLLGVVVGAGATIGVEVVRVWAEARLDGTKRKDNRRLKRDDHQRDWLIAVQDAIHELMRDPTVEAMLLVWKLRSRIADKETRDLVADLIVAVTQVQQARGAEAHGAAADKAAEVARSVMDRTGVLILATFVEPDRKSGLWQRVKGLFRGSRSS